MVYADVVFPCDIPQWGEIKEKLLHLALESHFLSARLLVNKLGDIRSVIPISQATPGGRGRKRHEHVKDAGDSNCFSGLDTFLEESFTEEEREIFFCRVLPYIIRKAVEIENLKPSDGLKIAGQQESEVALPRNLIASILACSLLCLWPQRPGKFNPESPLNAINFDEFYHLCKKRLHQCAKLKCILHYFETLSVLYRAPTGSVVFHRQVLPESPKLSDWLSCDDALCHMTVFSAGLIEDAGPNVLQVDFANRRIGGAVLANGCVQEEIRFCTCPELIGGMLFQSIMGDNEAIIIQGFENFSYYKGYSSSFRYAGPYHDPAQEDERGNLQNYLCVIDALPFKGHLTEGQQYGQDFLLRELNKAYVGFNQKCLKLKEIISDRESPEQQAVSAMSTVVEQYFATLSEDILTNALQDTLVASHEDSTSSSQYSQLHTQSEQMHLDHSENSDHRDYTRRRSSNLSDISRRASDISRRGSNFCDSRRSSSTSGSSRRSSGTQQSASSEYSSELEEYFATFQQQHIVKSSTIEEETADQNSPKHHYTLPPPLPTMQEHAGPSMQHHSSPEVPDRVLPTMPQQLPPAMQGTILASKSIAAESSSGDHEPQIVRPKIYAHVKDEKTHKRLTRSKPEKQKCDKISNTGKVSSASDNSQKANQKKRNKKQQPEQKRKTKAEEMPIPDFLAERILAESFSQVKSQKTQTKKSVSKCKAAVPIQDAESRGDFYPVVVDIEPESDSNDELKRACPRYRKVVRTSKPATTTTHDKHVTGSNVGSGRNSDLHGFATSIVDGALESAILEIHRMNIGEDQESTIFEDANARQKVEGFVGGIMESIWTRSQYNVKRHIKETHQEQQTWTSDSEIDLDLDLYCYADDFVSNVLEDAVETFKTQKREEQERLEAMWRRAQERFELDAMYFDAEFSRYSKDDEPKMSSRFTRSVMEQDLIRRRSLDELGKYGHGHRQNGYHLHVCDDNGINFDKTERKSPLLLTPGGRRASEPITRRRGSFDVQWLQRSNQGLHALHSQRRRGSSGCSSTSREMILDWLNQHNQSNQSNRFKRYRTTSSHMDWFVQDLLLEAFTDAFKEIFGDSIFQELTDNSHPYQTSSGSSRSTDLCDISLNIPDATSGMHSSLKPKHSSQYLTVSTESSSETEYLSPRNTKQSLDKHQLKSKRTKASTFHSKKSDLKSSLSDIKPSCVGSQSPRNTSKLSVPKNKSSKKDREQSSSSSSVDKMATQSRHDSQSFPEISISVQSQSELSSRIRVQSAQSRSDHHSQSQQHEEQNQQLSRPTAISASTEQMIQGIYDNIFNSALEGTTERLQETVIIGGSRNDTLTVQSTEVLASVAMGSDHATSSRQRSPKTGSRSSSRSPSIQGGGKSPRREKKKSAARKPDLPVKRRTQCLPIATGNWGCGAYRGDPQLKAFIQWMAASRLHTPNVFYYTFEHRMLEELGEICRQLEERETRVSQLAQLVIDYCNLRNSAKNKRAKVPTLFEFIKKAEL